MSKVVFSTNSYLQLIAEQKDTGSDKLLVSELFYDTMQGEGPTAGTPAVFLRLAGCTLNCRWCDTKESWKNGFKISVNTLVDLMSKTGVFDVLRNGAHLVVTGGSPLLQQKKLVKLFEKLTEQLLFTPIIEVENEVVIKPCKEILPFVDFWNNSPKLSNSGNSILKVYNRELLEYMNALSNSVFKFVVENERDVMEIEVRYVEAGVISRKNVWLMPQGATRNELKKIRGKIAALAIKYGFHYTDRLQVLLWNDKKSV